MKFAPSRLSSLAPGVISHNWAEIIDAKKFWESLTHISQTGEENKEILVTGNREGTEKYNFGSYFNCPNHFWDGLEMRCSY
jgi:hypothetical protein